MKSITLVASVTFLEAAKSAFHFPVNNVVRTSFWMLGENETTPCQIETVKPIELKTTM